jgi:hypothetical protein
MDTIFVKKETEGKTCKTKSGKDIDTEKYKKLCDNLQMARTARKQKGGTPTPQPPTGDVATPAPESKPEPPSPVGGKGVGVPPPASFFLRAVLAVWRLSQSFLYFSVSISLPDFVLHVLPSVSFLTNIVSI